MITGFFDQNHNFENVIETAKKHNLKTICLRKYNDKPILKIDNKILNEINNKLKKQKLTVSLIDANIYLPFYSEKLQREALNDFLTAIKISNIFKTNLIVIEIGEIIDIVEELENIIKILTPFSVLALENKKEIVIKFYEKQKTAEIAYLFRNLNNENFKVLFEPKSILRNNEAPATAYRLFRNYIGAFIAQDESADGKPELLGYGDADMINLFKRLRRDKYNYPLICDPNFTEEDIDFTSYKHNFFMRIIKKEKKRNFERETLLKKRLFNDDFTKDITLDKILDEQIKTLRIVFRQTK